MDLILTWVPDNPQPLPLQAFGLPRSLHHYSMAKELVAFAKHAGPSFEDDNVTVYGILQEVLAGVQRISSIKPYQQACDDRAAFQALQVHNMGNSKWEKVVEAAETLVSQQVWDGCNSCYTLKSYISKLCEAHNDFLRASQHIAYAVLNDATRVQRLLKSIQTKDGTVLLGKSLSKGTLF